MTQPPLPPDHAHDQAGRLLLDPDHCHWCREGLWDWHPDTKQAITHDPQEAAGYDAPTDR